MRKIVIKNKFRFICFLLVLFSLMYALFVSLFNLSNVYSKSYDEYAVYYVHSGDTLWEIAEKNNLNNVDTRKLINEIKEVNNIGSEIFAGQEIKIPV